MTDAKSHVKRSYGFTLAPVWAVLMLLDWRWAMVCWLCVVQLLSSGRWSAERNEGAVRRRDARGRRDQDE